MESRIDLRIDQKGDAAPKLDKLAVAVERAAKAWRALRYELERAEKTTRFQGSEAERNAKALAGLITAEEKYKTQVERTTKALRDRNAEIERGVKIGTSGSAARGRSDMAPSSVGQALGTSRMMTAPLAGLAAVAGFTHTLQGAFQAASGAAKALYANPYLDELQRDLELRKSVPLFGSVVRANLELLEARKGVTARLFKQEVEAERAGIVSRITGQGELEAAALLARMGGFENRAIAAGRFAMPIPEGFDRSTYAGRLREAEQTTMLPALEELVRARRERFAVDADRTEAQSRQEANRQALQRAQDAYKQAMATFQAAGKNVGPDANELERRAKAEKDAALRSAEKAVNEQLEIQKRIRAENVRLQELGVKHAEAESRVRQANIGVMRAELQVLTQREARMSEGQRRLGAMGEGEYQLATAMMKEIKKSGLENATPEMVAWASRVAPNMVGDLQEKLGEKRALEQAALGNLDFEEYAKGERLDATRQQINKLRADVQVKLDLDTESTAKDIAENLKPLLKEVFKIMAVEIKMELQKDWIQRQIRWNQEAG